MALSAPSDPAQLGRAGSADRSAAPSGSHPTVSTSPAVPDARPLLRPARLAAPAAVHSLASKGVATQTRRVCVRVANVRSGPGTSYRVLTTVRKGTTVRGTASRGWLRIRTGRWISLSVTCRPASGAAASGASAGAAPFEAWVRAIDPAGNARWVLDHRRTHTRGNVRGLTVFRGSGPARSTVYIQPGMSWSRTRLVMAHEAIHVRQIRYGGFSHSLRAFGSVSGMERAADCGATLILGQVVRSGCSSATATRVRRLLSGRPA